MEKNKKLKKNTVRYKYILIIVILLIFALFFIQVTLQNLRTNGLFSYDPYYHLLLSKNTQSTGTINEKFGNCIVPLNAAYPSLLRINSVIFSLISGTDIFYFYKFAGPLIIFLLSIVSVISLRRILNTKKYFSLFLILFLSSGYILWRSLITYPENLVLVFLMLSFYSIIRKQNLLFVLFLVASLFTHERSLLIHAVILIPFWFVMNKDKIFNKKFIFYIILIILLSSPFFIPAYNQINTYFNEHLSFVGSAGIKSSEFDKSRYSPLSFNDFNKSLGFLPLLFSFFFIPLLFKVRNKKLNIFIFAWVILFLIASLGNYFGIFIPYYRMFSHLFLPLFLLSSISLFFFFHNYLNKKTKLIVSFIICLIFIFTLFNTQGSIYINNEDFNAIEAIKNKEDGPIVSISPTPMNLGVENVECNQEIIFEIFSSTSEKELNALLKNRYNKEKVYFYLKKSELSLIMKENPLIYKKLIERKVYDSYRIKVFEWEVK